VEGGGAHGGEVTASCIEQEFLISVPRVNWASGTVARIIKSFSEAFSLHTLAVLST
jgi:hypothetical protein